MNFKSLLDSTIDGVSSVPVGLCVLTLINPYVGAGWLAFNVGKAVIDFKSDSANKALSEEFYNFIKYMADSLDLDFSITAPEFVRAMKALKADPFYKFTSIDTDEDFALFIKTLILKDREIKQSLTHSLSRLS